MIDYNATSLPINLLEIARKAGIKVRNNSEVLVLKNGLPGAALLVNGVWHIVFDDKEPVHGRRRFTIAHELGHIFMGHGLINGRAFDTTRPQAESEADMFAARLLAPACVLWGLKIRTAEDIARICEISMAAAKIRAERMEILYERNKFLTNPLERRVFEQFKKYIDGKH